MDELARTLSTGDGNVRTGHDADLVRTWTAGELERAGARHIRTGVPLKGRFYTRRVDVAADSLGVLCTRIDRSLGKSVGNRLEQLVATGANLAPMPLGFVVVVSAREWEGSGMAADRLHAGLSAMVSAGLYSAGGLAIWDAEKKPCQTAPGDLDASTLAARLCGGIESRTKAVGRE